MEVTTGDVRQALESVADVYGLDFEIEEREEGIVVLIRRGDDEHVKPYNYDYLKGSIAASEVVFHQLSGAAQDLLRSVAYNKWRAGVKKS